VAYVRHSPCIYQEEMRRISEASVRISEASVRISEASVRIFSFIDDIRNCNFGLQTSSSDHY
jgi:hypothetical protein